ncbi:hypothetical protein [Longimicrobium sp.]|uniref:hypothetical protein n=1 Tax=Longimicrobium sp. TaxID=2029185 RepID=UPI003B3B191E
MKKLKLQLEDLAVGSFVPDERVGEVHGMQVTPRCTAELGCYPSRFCSVVPACAHQEG